MKPRDPIVVEAVALKMKELAKSAHWSAPIESMPRYREMARDSLAALEAAGFKIYIDGRT